ncbi:hypothetical protein AX14_002040 [Amanita brunnescens Koide BX004]|nr:hypothetical protein AX14_002040 [Amanita brunnescens Koide BX004]
MGKSKGKKRKAQGVGLPDWMQKLLALANNGQTITVSQIQKASISSKWSELAPQFDIFVDLTMARFDSFSIAPVLLPPSFHETTAEAAWRMQDVFQEQLSQNREKARLRTFEPYILPIVGLFQGRIIDRPEHTIRLTAYSSGCEVEHALLMVGGTLFIVIEMKLGFERHESIAQLFLELLATAGMNKKDEPEGLRVHGLLTDLQAFHFYSYDQSRRKFAFDETLQASATRERFMADMIHVTNKVFSVILFAYVEGLAASVKLDRERLSASPTGSSPAQQIVRNRTNDNTRELALDFAVQCLNKFHEPVRTIEDVEKQSCEAIGLLTKSVRCIPRISYYSGKEDPSTENELRALVRRAVRTEHMTMVGA